jgi:formylmethanofuran dehydrogenase subunit A
MALVRLKRGRIYDPMQGIDGEVRDLFIHDGRIVAGAPSDAKIDHEYDLAGKVVMAGAIDLHTHIGGGKMNLARAMLPDDHRDHGIPRTDLTRSGCGHAAPSTLTAGYRYAQMGYTACFEPAMLPANARHAHLEMGDTPIVDKGAYAMLGSDDFLLRLLASHADQRTINDYVGWTMHATQSIGIKVVNPGGISAFKFNARSLDLDEPHLHYQVTPRRILAALTRALDELSVPHALHVHGCNLGVPGNLDTTLKTIQGAEGLPLHLTHIQFHSYATEGDRRFSSGAAKVAEAINSNPNVSADVGQVMFGQTVTASGDSMAQYGNHSHANPKKWVVMDIECDAGCGVVPFRYRDKNFVNALQWAIGLELFLLVRDPWRIFLTTDHPNGAPFTSYPRLIRLLMDKSFRDDMLDGIHADAKSLSVLASIKREYTLYEIAILTRAGPAKSLGLADRGRLSAGAAADITVYDEDPDRERMFAQPAYVFKDGKLVVKHGEVVASGWGNTHVVRPDYDFGIENELERHFARYHTVRLGNFKLSDDELSECGHGNRIIEHPCHRR